MLVKLDFSNTFNSIHRREMLLAVHSRMPELYSFCCSAYSQPSVLFFLANTLFSLKRVPNKVTQLGHFSSVILFSHCCHLCISILSLVIWTTVIAELANRSFREGIFPSCFKRASVVPLLKKPSLDKHAPSSYRPISNLDFISKILERLFLARIQPHT